MSRCVALARYETSLPPSVFSSPKIRRWPTGESIKGKSFSFTSARRVSSRYDSLEGEQLVSDATAVGLLPASPGQGRTNVLS